MIHRECCQIIILIYQQETIKLLRFSCAALLFKNPKQTKRLNRKPSALGAGNKGDSLGVACEGRLRTLWTEWRFRGSKLKARWARCRAGLFVFLGLLW